MAACKKCKYQTRRILVVHSRNYNNNTHVTIAGGCGHSMFRCRSVPMSFYVIFCRSLVACGRVTNRPSMCPRKTVFYRSPFCSPTILQSCSKNLFDLTQQKRLSCLGPRCTYTGVVPSFETTLCTPCTVVVPSHFIRTRMDGV